VITQALLNVTAAASATFPTLQGQKSKVIMSESFVTPYSQITKQLKSLHCIFTHTKKTRKTACFNPPISLSTIMIGHPW